MERSKDPKFEKAFRDLELAITAHLRSQGTPLDAPIELTVIHERTDFDESWLQDIIDPSQIALSDMTADFKHYRPFGSDSESFKWALFNPAISDQELTELMSPLAPTEIRRTDDYAIVHFISSYAGADALRKKLDQWNVDHKAEAERQRELAAIESQRRFDEYYKSLNLDEYIEGPAIATSKDGKEEITFRIKIDRPDRA